MACFVTYTSEERGADLWASAYLTQNLAEDLASRGHHRLHVLFSAGAEFEVPSLHFCIPMGAFIHYVKSTNRLKLRLCYSVITASCTENKITHLPVFRSIDIFLIFHRRMKRNTFSIPAMSPSYELCYLLRDRIHPFSKS